MECLNLGFLHNSHNRMLQIEVYEWNNCGSARPQGASHLVLTQSAPDEVYYYYYYGSAELGVQARLN